MKFCYWRLLFFLSLTFCYSQETFSQDSVYISSRCFDELALRCFSKKVDLSNIVRIKRKKHLIKKDLAYLKKVQAYIQSSDTTWTYRLSESSAVERRQRKKSDSIIVTSKIYLNYFNVNVYTFFIAGNVIAKMAIINNARTFYCKFDDIKAPHDYSLIDPVFFERYLKPSLRITYSYDCSEIYVGRFGVPWGLY